MVNRKTWRKTPVSERSQYLLALLPLGIVQSVLRQIGRFASFFRGESFSPLPLPWRHSWFNAFSIRYNAFLFFANPIMTSNNRLSKTVNICPFRALLTYYSLWFVTVDFQFLYCLDTVNVISMASLANDGDFPFAPNPIMTSHWPAIDFQNSSILRI